MSFAPFDLDRIGAGLVFGESMPDLQVALRGGVAVVQAPPGTGKTTLVPPAVANMLHERSEQGRSGRVKPGIKGTEPKYREAGQPVPGPRDRPPHDRGQRVVVVQPRRVAARAAARRLAQLTGTRPGDVVGWSVRGEQRTSAATRIEFVTPGILLRRVLKDPELAGTAAVILDEVHERGVESDLLVGMLAELRQLREDLVLVAMSATVDATRFATLLGDAPVVDCPSALHPLEVRWAPGPQRLDERGVTPAFLDHVARTAAEAHRDALQRDPATDALVFLPGAREVSRVASALHSLTDAEILELHGRLDPREQDRAVAGRRLGEPPRIVVSTSLAESSLTVDGVRLVVDSGLSRQPRRDAARGISGLVTVSASKASAEQRAGRAARQGPGTVVRCYDDAAWGAMPAHTVPEVRTADLTFACLALAVWGTPGGEGLALPDPLPPRARADAESELHRLGAIDDAGRATPLGHTLAAMPVEPRWARALVRGSALVGSRLAAGVVATVNDAARVPGADLPALVRRFRSGQGDARRWSQEVSRLQRIAEEHGRGSGEDGAVPREAREGVVVGLGKPEWLARRVDAAGEQWLLASGTRAGLEAGSALRHHEWLAVAELSRAAGRAAAGTGAVIRAAAPLDEATALRVAGPLVRDETRATFADGRVRARRVRAVGAIELSSTPVAVDPDTAVPAIRRALAEQGLGLLPWPEEAIQLRARLALLQRDLGQPWPAMDEHSLVERIDEWLGVELAQLARGGSLRSINTVAALKRLMPWPDASRFEELVPQRLAVPSGTTARVHYPEVFEPGDTAGPPVVRVKLQECFGLSETPRLVAGRVPVQFHLLSPAQRPLAITDDLASFWSGPYHQVRSEMRGRYPKHPWPEDPWNAVATARTKRASGR